MVYGDNPDPNNPIPDLDAIRQSGNLYVYCMNNPIRYFDPTGLDSYIIYTSVGGDNFSDQAKYEFKKLGGDANTIHMIAVNSAQEFIDAWNSMGSNGKSIDSVFMNVHSNGLSIIFNGSSTDAISINGYNYSGGQIRSFSELNYQKTGMVYILACNSGNLDLYNGTPVAGGYGEYFQSQSYGATGNVASALSNRTNGLVLGSDAELSYGTGLFRSWGPLGNYKPRIENGSKVHGNYYRLSGDRKNQGFNIYWNGNLYGGGVRDIYSSGYAY